MRIGTDIVEVERITKAISNGNSCFLQQVFTCAEIDQINPHEPDYERASGFWAAKEAIVKQWVMDLTIKSAFMILRSRMMNMESLSF